MRKLRGTLLVLLIILGSAAAWWRYSPRTVPAGQPPLVTLDTASLSTLRDDFNRAGDDVRIIVLLSPT
jgi:hypothetical protein